jgi:hypothetical protein
MNGRLGFVAERWRGGRFTGKGRDGTNECSHCGKTSLRRDHLSKDRVKWACNQDQVADRDSAGAAQRMA